LNIYIAAHCHLPGRLCRYCQQKKKDIKNERAQTSGDAKIATESGPGLESGFSD